MRKHILIVMTAIIVLALAIAAIAADPFVGTWKLNVAKSKYSPGPGLKSSMCTVRSQDNGVKIDDNIVEADGKAVHIEFAATFDGKDYTLKGSPSVDTIALKRIDANSWSEVFKKDGKQIASGRITVSRDGKTMIHATKGKNDKGQESNDTVVWNKQ